MQDAWCLKVKPRERAFKQFKSHVLNVLISEQKLMYYENNMYRHFLTKVYK